MSCGAVLNIVLVLLGALMHALRCGNFVIGTCYLFVIAVNSVAVISVLLITNFLCYLNFGDT